MINSKDKTSREQKKTLSSNKQEKKSFGNHFFRNQLILRDLIGGESSDWLGFNS